MNTRISKTVIVVSVLLAACAAEAPTPERGGVATEVGLLVPAQSEYARAMGIVGWDVRVGRPGLQVRGIGERNAPRGAALLQMRSDGVLNGALLVVRAKIGGTGQLVVRHDGEVLENTLQGLVGAPVWFTAFSDDLGPILSGAGGLTPYTGVFSECGSDMIGAGISCGLLAACEGGRFIPHPAARIASGLACRLGGGGPRGRRDCATDLARVTGCIANHRLAEARREEAERRRREEAERRPPMDEEMPGDRREDGTPDPEMDPESDREEEPGRREEDEDLIAGDPDSEDSERWADWGSESPGEEEGDPGTFEEDSTLPDDESGLPEEDLAPFEDDGRGEWGGEDDNGDRWEDDWTDDSGDGTDPFESDDYGWDDSGSEDYGSEDYGFDSGEYEV
ncbi:MAG: hypothetical protein NZ898_14730 [Myxococcota bacterium]|nr:hypothetical protein [Myxococcota bacterium]MDW8361789.1 hypothetical protein [Myxococcales bacterium]